MGGPWNNILKFCNNPLIHWICLIQAFPLDNTVFYKKAFLPPIAFYKLDNGSLHFRMRLEEAPKLEEVPKLPYIIPSGFLAIMKSHSNWILPLSLLNGNGWMGSRSNEPRVIAKLKKVVSRATNGIILTFSNLAQNNHVI